MNFCLEDGAVLNSANNDHTLSDRTLSFGLNRGRQTNDVKQQTRGQRFGQTGADFSTSEQQTVVYPPRKSHLGAIIASVIIGLSILSGVFIFGVISRIAKSERDDYEVAESTPKPVRPKTLFTPQLTTDKIKVEIGEKVKGGFDETFVKCLITNTGEQVVEVPRISLTLYKNDLKLGNVSSEAEMKYLKPGQTVPIWINLYKNKDYTAARFDETAKYSIVSKDPNLLFPNVVYTDAKMSSEIGTSLINFRPFKETFYKVKGTLENREYDLLKLKIYVIFYNDKSEIVGITDTNPPDLKRNEKAEFEASMGDKKLFGMPVRFELIAVDDSKIN